MNALLILLGIPAILLFLHVTDKEPLSSETSPLTNRQVKKGKHDYKPGHGWWPVKNRYDFQLDFVIPGTAWIDPTKSGPLGRDGKDWNKLGGLSYFSFWKPKTWPKNRNSVLIAFRSDPEPGWFQVCAYTNDAEGKWQNGKLADGKVLRIQGDRFGTAFCTVSKGEAFYLINSHKAAIQDRHDFAPLKMAIPVGPWHGGNMPAAHSHYLETRLQ